MQIRSEQPADYSAIRAVHATSFPTLGEAHLVDALRLAGKLSISLCAIVDDQLVGHLAFSPVSLEGGDNGLGMAPVAVIHAHRRQGIAEQLIREGLAASADLNAGFVVVLGDPKYYRRFGFLPASKWQLEDTYGGGDAFQAMELRTGAIPDGGGLVRYAAEFDGLEGAGAS